MIGFIGQPSQLQVSNPVSLSLNPSTLDPRNKMKCHNKECTGELQLKYSIKDNNGVADFTNMRWVCSKCDYSLSPGEIKKALQQKGIISDPRK